MIIIVSHSWLRKKLLPKSLRFSPPIRSNRGFRLARKHGFEFLKLRITECHLSINKKKQLISKISIELKEKLRSEQWKILEKHNRLVQNSTKTKTTSSH